MAGLTLDGLPAATLARRWGVPQCRLEASVTSTLDLAHRLAETGAPAGTVILAEEQTAGRGRDGRPWHSPVGGIWLAMVLQPSHAALATASIRVGLVLADVVDELARDTVARLKWPNDVLIRDRKLAGILCEGRWQGDVLQWLALGVGVNVANPIPAAVRDGAIALEEVISGIRRIDVLDRLVPALTRVALPGGQLSDAERTAFAARDWLQDRDLRAPIVGRAMGLRADGALLVAVADGMTAIREGHVELA